MKNISMALILGVLLMPLPAMSERTVPDTLSASEAFADLPISVIDLLDRSRRLDMLDYYSADSIANVRNAMGGVSFLEDVTPDYLKACLTPVTTIAVKVLPAKRGDIVMTAYTVGDKDQAYDTDLRFFDSSYRELKRDRYIKSATLDDFFDYPDKEAKKLVAELVPFPTVRYEPDVSGTGMSAELTVGQIMSADDYGRIRNFLRPRLYYRWNGSRFNLEK